MTTGIQQADRIEIREGLADGERVVSGPAEIVGKQLTEGQKLRITDVRP